MSTVFTYSEQLANVGLLAQKEAYRFRHTQITPSHLLLAIARTPDCTACKLIELFGVDARKVRLDMEAQLEVGTAAEANPAILLDASALTAMAWAEEEAHHMCRLFVGTEHLLLGLLRCPETPAGQVLRKLGFDLQVMRGHVQRLTADAKAKPPVHAPDGSLNEPLDKDDEVALAKVLLKALRAPVAAEKPEVIYEIRERVIRDGEPFMLVDVLTEFGAAGWSLVERTGSVLTFQRASLGVRGPEPK